MPNSHQSYSSPSNRRLAIRSFSAQDLSGPGVEIITMKHSQGVATVVDACLTTLQSASQSQAHHVIHPHPIETPSSRLGAGLAENFQIPNVSGELPMFETESNQESHDTYDFSFGLICQEMDIPEPDNRYVLGRMLTNGNLGNLFLFEILNLTDQLVVPEQIFVQTSAQLQTPKANEQGSVSQQFHVEDVENPNLYNLLPPSS